MSTPKPVETWLDPDYDGYFDDTDENLLAAGFTKVIESTPAARHAEELERELQGLIDLADTAEKSGGISNSDLFDARKLLERIEAERKSININK